MLNIRVNSFNENGLGEPEQHDANSALTDLDKGLRSTKVGEQCEAIVRFPKLFEKYPFPILINASLLKLADVFRMGNNFLRLCVLRVCQQSEKHLDKISSVDEFVRRVFSVIHSNDPVARAVTLRTFGAVAAIIPERQQVHHSIRSSLDSHDNVEVEAAIYAAVRFAAQSKSFAVSMCNKVSDMIQGQSTPADMKLQLIPILQYMHHDTNTAAMVRGLCVDLLPSYPAQDFVLVTLNTLTQLAAATLVDVPSQVTLLLKYLRNDPRWEVKSKCLQFLYKLAAPGAHLWPPGAIDNIIDFALQSSRPKVLTSVLAVLQVLVQSPRMCHDHRNSADSALWQLCTKNCYSPHSELAIQSIQILTEILCYCYNENLDTEGTDEVITSLETQILLLTFSSADDSKNIRYLKLALRCAVRLCEARKEHCDTFIELLGTRMDNNNSECMIIVCEALGAIGGLKSNALLPLLGKILNLLDAVSKEITAEENSNTVPQQEENNERIKIMLCTLIFQIMSEYQWDEDTEKAIFSAAGDNNDENTNLWSNYCLARAALRYGHQKIAHKLFCGMGKHISLEHFHFWLVSLKEMTRAETELLDESKGLVSRLETASIHYNKAISSAKAASTPSHNLQFQAEYMRIRLEFLQCLAQLIYTCNILCIVPPPAIASTIVQNTRDEYQRHGYITNQLRKCAKEFKNCGELYWKLYQTAFDGDPATLENMQILQQLCVLVEQSIESVCVNGMKIREEPIEFGTENTRLESQQLIRSCHNVLKVGRAINEETGCTITHKHAELLKKIAQLLVEASIPIPRYFFQVLQCTNIKLAISPQPRVAGEFVSVQANSQLAVKVEGVVQHGSKPGLYRRVREIIIIVILHFQFSGKGKESQQQLDTKIPELIADLSQTITPHKDFFSAQFLLAFPRGGQYQLTIDASVIDEESNTWRTGPKTTLTLKVPEEAKIAPITVPGMATNANCILMPEDNLFIRSHQKKM